MQRIENTKYQAGFTLIELLVVIVIASILAGLAAPSFSTFVNNTRQTSLMSQLLGDLNRARSEAIGRNVRVLVCVRAGTENAPVCGAGADWSNGWLVCRDNNADGVCEAGTATDRNPIVVHHQLQANLSLTVTSGAFPVRFNPSGISGNGAATFTVGGNWAGAQSKVISLAGTGSISRP